jgi:replication factor C subunit 1
MPFMKASNLAAMPKKSAKDVPDLEEAIEEEDDGEAVEANEPIDDELDLKGDKYIKQPKAKAKKPAKKSAKTNDEEESDDAKPKKGKGKAGGKGKGKK